ncbi:hypothetical protein ACM66B_005082 [Microbotryomycetes sp. NB124-2]
MFSFSFDIDESELDQDLAQSTASLRDLNIAADTNKASTSSAIPHAVLNLDELIAILPPSISYSPVTIRTSGKDITLLRRDLFDARFQVISLVEQQPADSVSEGHKGKAKETFVDKDTDLVKGVYEGGLKTWECSLDLVRVAGELAFDDKEGPVRGRSIIELGCGTALPSCSVFARLLAEIRRAPTQSQAEKPARTRIHLQDYNKQVLSLITLPNILLTFAQHLATPEHAPDADEDPAPTLPGELDVTPEFLDAFQDLLASENIELVFSEGDWADLHSKGLEKYDVVITSETVYSLESLPPLLDVIEAACHHDTTCLVACKRIYFGVGGGELEFRRQAEERRCRVETVWPAEDVKNVGVARVVMRCTWTKEAE